MTSLIPLSFITEEGRVVVTITPPFRVRSTLRGRHVQVTGHSVLPSVDEVRGTMDESPTHREYRCTGSFGYVPSLIATDSWPVTDHESSIRRSTTPGRMNRNQRVTTVLGQREDLWSDVTQRQKSSRPLHRRDYPEWGLDWRRFRGNSRWYRSRTPYFGWCTGVHNAVGWHKRHTRPLPYHSGMERCGSTTVGTWMVSTVFGLRHENFG